jgi:hypothetical protein
MNARSGQGKVWACNRKPGRNLSSLVDRLFVPWANPPGSDELGNCGVGTRTNPFWFNLVHTSPYARGVPRPRGCVGTRKLEAGIKAAKIGSNGNRTCVARVSTLGFVEIRRINTVRTTSTTGYSQVEVANQRHKISTLRG